MVGTVADPTDLIFMVCQEFFWQTTSNPYFSPALRRASIIRSFATLSLNGYVCSYLSTENLGFILRISFAAARASSMEPAISKAEVRAMYAIKVAFLCKLDVNMLKSVNLCKNALLLS